MSERISTQLAVSLLLPAGCVEATTRNVSIRGMFILTDVIVPVGSVFRVRLRVPTLQDEIDADVAVRWRQPDGIGVGFANLRALDIWGLHQLLTLERRMDVERAPWDRDMLDAVLAHRRLYLATGLVAASAPGPAEEIRRELAELDRDIAAGVANLDAERRKTLQERYSGWLAGARDDTTTSDRRGSRP